MIIKAENGNYKKSTLELSVTFDSLSNPQAAFGYSWKEQATPRQVTGESGKYKAQELATSGCPCTQVGRSHGVRHEKNALSLLTKSQHSRQRGYDMARRERTGKDSKTLRREKGETGCLISVFPPSVTQAL